MLQKLSELARQRLLHFWYNNPLAEVARQYPIHLTDEPGSKVVIVATRPPKFPLSGGMAPAVKEACKGFARKYWYAYGTIEPEGALKRMLLGAFNGYHRKTVPISAYEVAGFRVRQVVADDDKWDAQYNRYCNQVVWPLCHNLPDYAKPLEIDDYSGNLGANETIAKRIVQDLNGDEKTPIWIHDYHHLPLANTLRILGVTNPIVYFHHIPLPTLETLEERNESERSHFKDMLKSLRACDAILFQTEEVTKRFYDIIDEDAPENIPAYSGNFISSPSNPRRQVYVGHTPISINTEKEMSVAQDRMLRTKIACDLDEQLVAENIFINFERCDYSKGILQRVHAFEQLMKDRPDLRGRAQMVLSAEPTRGTVREYRQYANDVKAVVDRINKKSELQTNGQFPIIFNNHNVDHDDCVRMMRNRKAGQRRIGLITPHEDGMNLTAKEFAAAQDQTNAGTLVISSGAGTAKELALNGKGALIYPKIKNGNVDVLVRAMAESIDMPQDEANHRAEAMQAHLKKFDLQRWSSFTKRIFERIQAGTFFKDPAPSAPQAVAPVLEMAK